jgi:hypothetical protein
MIPPLITPPTTEDLAAAQARRATARAWLKKHARDLGGLACLAMVITGVWGLAGWAWALIAAGTPGTAFYLVGEFRGRN